MHDDILIKLKEVCEKHPKVSFARACFIFVFGHTKSDSPDSILELTDEEVLNRLDELINQREEINEGPSENRRSMSPVMSEMV